MLLYKKLLLMTFGTTLLLGLPDQERIIRTRHVANVEAKRNYRVLVAKFEGEHCLIDLGVDMRIILKFIAERNFHL